MVVLAGKMQQMSRIMLAYRQKRVSKMPSASQTSRQRSSDTHQLSG